jgi:hypothetical protein
MIYLLAIALLLTAVGFFIKARQKGAFTIILDVAIAIVFGFLAGIIIGIGARAGMWAVAVANGAEPSFSLSGTSRVVATFACFGIVFGLIYEGLLRKILRRRSLIFGIIITLAALYPTSTSVTQTLNFQPTAISLLLFSAAGAALMFVPFAIFLEVLLKFWHRRDEKILVADPITLK